VCADGVEGADGGAGVPDIGVLAIGVPEIGVLESGVRWAPLLDRLGDEAGSFGWRSVSAVWP